MVHIVSQSATSSSLFSRAVRRKYTCVSRGSLAATAVCLLLGKFILYSFLFGNSESAGGQHAVQVEKIAPMGTMIYGAKGKKERTGDLVKQALESGFRHIATASMHREYNESGVGEGWSGGDLLVKRNDIYLQTLFVPNTNPEYSTAGVRVQLLHDPPKSVEEQVHNSIMSSLFNLKTTYLDAVLYHNFRNKLEPYDEMMSAWRTLEGYVDRGIIRQLGIVNCHDEEYLRRLYVEAKVKPTIIQNRFHGNRGFDVKLRPLFKEFGITNQLFWTLTGNWNTLRSEAAKSLAENHGITPEMYMYAFLRSLDLSPLIGTSSREHMDQDMSISQREIVWGEGERQRYASLLKMKFTEVA